jgi:hypothetical protein
MPEIAMWRPEDADTPLLRPLLEIVHETRTRGDTPVKA